MTAHPLPDVEYLDKILSADFELGKLWWKPRTPDMFSEPEVSSFLTRSAIWKCNVWNTNWAGKEGFTSISNTYRSGSIDKKKVKAHRVLFKMYHGFEPEEVDHYDGDPLNNCISNLVPSTRRENMKNTAKQYNNTSGVSGVVWDKSRNKWSARIEADTKLYHLGRYEKFEDAVVARRAAEKKFGFSEGHGRRDSKIREIVANRQLFS